VLRGKVEEREEREKRGAEVAEEVWEEEEPVLRGSLLVLSPSLPAL
jgi:hypothetical protein